MRHGVPTTECQPAATATAPRFPSVCKPRYGAGSQATYLVPDASALAALLADPELQPDLLGEALLQPCLRLQHLVYPRNHVGER